MSGTWVHKRGSATMVIDRAALGHALAPTFPHLNALADQVAEEARRILPNEAMSRFIGVKRAGVRAPSNQGLWRLRLRGRRYASGTGQRLMRDVEVPVALVTNNSQYAMVWEYGAAPVRAVNVVRKRSRVKAGVMVYRPVNRGATKAELERQYQPLTLAAQRVGARAVIRYRRPRSGS